MTKILIVEDDLRLSELIQRFLIKNGFEVYSLANGGKVLAFLQKLTPDLIILDIMLPEVDGLTLCRDICTDYEIPVLFLTAKDSDLDQITGLEMGADDYIIKPIEPKVLLARIKTLLRRINKHNLNTNEKIESRILSVSKKEKTVVLSGKPLVLTSYEFELFWLLAKNAGKVLSREKIHDLIIGRDFDGLDRSADVRISRLRKKLSDIPNNPIKIITAWGKGYSIPTLE